MEKQVQQNLHESPADSELRRKLADEFVSDAAYGRFVRTTLPFLNPRPVVYPYNLTRYLPEGITRRELGTIKLTAQFMAAFGIFFQRALMERVIQDSRFDFITKPPDDSKHSFYYGLCFGYMPSDDSKFSFCCRLFLGYMASLMPCPELTRNAGASPETVLVGFFDLLALLEKHEDEGAVVDLHVVEFLAEMLGRGRTLIAPPGHALKIDGSSCNYWRNSVSYHACYQQTLILRQDHPFCVQPSPSQRSDLVPMGPPAMPPPKFTNLIPEGITQMELGIIKLTAQFEAVYGLFFRSGIDKSVNADPRFEFLKHSDSRYSFYAQLSCGYRKVLIPSRMNEALALIPSLETVLGGFWNVVEMLEENGVDLGMADLRAFEYFVNTEDQELVLPLQYVVMMMYPLVPPFDHLQVQVPRDHFPPPPRREDRNPKRLKVTSAQAGLVVVEKEKEKTRD